jgi:hypothetical protein
MRLLCGTLRSPAPTVGSVVSLVCAVRAHPRIRVLLHVVVACATELPKADCYAPSMEYGNTPLYSDPASSERIMAA